MAHPKTACRQQTTGTVVFDCLLVLMLRHQAHAAALTACDMEFLVAQEGQHVEEFQPVCEVQSDKASVEITSRYKGIVRKLHHSVGDIVQVGGLLLTGQDVNMTTVHVCGGYTGGPCMRASVCGKVCLQLITRCAHVLKGVNMTSQLQYRLLAAWPWLADPLPSFEQR